MEITTQEARREHGYRYRTHVRSVVRKAPPLSEEQRDRLWALIRASSGPTRTT